MRIIFVRHGDPDYVLDSLTGKGRREATALAKWVAALDPEVTEYYVSPLGRARLTAEYCLKPLGKEATVLPWVEEYTGKAEDPKDPAKDRAWDFFPSDWTKDSDIFCKDTWLNSPFFSDPSCREGYEKLTNGFDGLMAEYGYHRDGMIYRTDVPGRDDGRTVVIFCHMIATLTIIGHVTGIAAPLLWHGFFSAPTGISVLQTEEREPGIAWLRVRASGETAHLLDAGEPVSDSGFFPDHRFTVVKTKP